MTQLLGMLDKMKDLDIVRFFSQFFTQEKLAPWFSWFQNATGGRTYGVAAKTMLLYAAILAVVVFVIDQAFYLTHPAKIETTRRRWYAIEDGFMSLGDNAKAVTRRVRSMWINRTGKAAKR
jgi:hypothetical protein